MKIEIGYYRTRDGRKARVFCTDRPGEYPVVGYIEVKGGDSIIESWTSEGRALASSEYQWDLISPWIDLPIVDWSKMPAWANWVALGRSGSWYFSIDQLEIGEHGLIGLSKAGIIPPEFSPTFTGRWQDSLVERPKA